MQPLTVSEFVSAASDTLSFSFESTVIEGEVDEFKINQGKYVFFTLKDESASLPCFLMLFNLHFPIENGMKIHIRGTPKITNWGKFSFTVDLIQPIGQGSIKKSLELLKAKLTKEGLFDLARKRPLPDLISKIAVVSSTGAAGYADFIKILNARWAGLTIEVAHVTVQGLDAPAQITSAIQYLNEHSSAEIIAILRGGGSADDLAAFNDETFVRTIASSKLPVITGIGHETDESLADLAADLRASTPSNAAELLVPDKASVLRENREALKLISSKIAAEATSVKSQTASDVQHLLHQVNSKIAEKELLIKKLIQELSLLSPESALSRGYAILSGTLKVGNIVKVTTQNKVSNLEVKNVQTRK